MRSLSDMRTIYPLWPRGERLSTLRTSGTVADCWYSGCRFQESARYMAPEDVNAFLDGAIRNRISVRLIAEQHLALTYALHNPPPDGRAEGVVETKCSPKKMIDMCGSFVSDLCLATLGNAPNIVLDGQTDATFT